MGLRWLLEACRVLEKVALKRSSKSTKYQLECSYDDLIHEHFVGHKIIKNCCRKTCNNNCTIK